MDKDLAQVCCERQADMELVRKSYEPLWDDITRLCNQRRDDYLQTDTKGRKRGKESWDGAANRALGIWSDGMQSFMVSPSLVWARAIIQYFHDDDEVRAWLQDYDRAMLWEFENSNFYSTIGELFRDAGSIGTATLYTESDAFDNCVHTAIHPGQVYIAEDKWGQVDTVHRKFTYTARQAYQMFGDRLSPTIIDAASKDPHSDYEFLHCVFPNTERLPEKLNSTNKPWRSVYIELAGKGTTQGRTQIYSEGTRIVRDGGYDRMPYAVWRFRKNSDEVYGYSPAADAIMEMETINSMSKRNIQAAQMMVEPPYNIPEEMRNETRLLPKGHNYYKDPKKIIMPVFTGINLPGTKEEFERLNSLLEDKFRVQFFLLLKGAEREMTATEIVERQSEQALLMGPQVGRLISEFLKPAYENVAEIARSRLPEPPDIVLDYAEELGGRIDVEFIGPLAQAQKRLFESQPIINTVNALAPILAVEPTTRYKFDWIGMAEDVAEANSCPQKRILPNEVVYARIEQEQQQQAAMQQAAMAKEIADTIPKLSKPVESGSPLEMLGAA